VTKTDLSNLYPPKELWPEFVFPLDQISIPEELNLAEELLEKHVREGRGSDIAVYYQNQRITFNTLNETVNRIGNSLLSLGVKPQDRIGVKLVNQPEALILNFAIQKIGAIPVMFSPLWPRKEDIHIIKSAIIRIFFVSQSLFEDIVQDSEFKRHVEHIIVVEEGHEQYKEKNVHSYLRMAEKEGKDLKPVKVRRDSTGLILFTSGTTGLPKGCLHSAGGILAQGFLANKYVFKLEEGDILTGSSPIAFTGGYCMFMVAPFCGRGAVSLIRKFQPDEVLRTVQEHKATILTGVPAAYRRLLQYEDFDKYDLSSLRLCTCGADAIKETGPQWKAKTGLDIWEGLAATELGFLVAHTRMGNQPKTGSCGAALPGWTIKCVDDQGRALPPGEVGHLIVRGPTGCLYLIDPNDETRMLNLQKKMVRNGWNYTGDMAHLDDEGFIFIASREDDMIKSGGFRIYPGEIEEVLSKHPNVREACVFGVPDPTRGQNVVACIELKDGARVPLEFEKELIALCQDHLAVYKTPRSFRYVEELPRTDTGKVMRSKVRDIWSDKKKSNQK